MVALSRKLPKIALTMGDAAGIGPELLIKALLAKDFRERAEFILYGEKTIFQASLERFGDNSDFENLQIVECSNLLTLDNLKIGEANKDCGIAAYEAVRQATLDALVGKVDAIVTAPMNKYSVNLAGINFSGHTEFIAELANCQDFAMMQSSGKLHVAFVTTHIPIADVAKNITFERVTKVTQLLHQVLVQEGVKRPKLAIMALNPHAGENGCMGSEDEEITRKVICSLRELSFDIDDMAVPDVIFANGNYLKYDGIVSMYHDQGHIPFKMLAFSSGVNSTLGLPIIRTSPDHGSAFDIAWQNRADTGSFFAAIDLAIKRASSSLK
jgi:4-hydroxythreonine-4-phosphate dehydrogenase